VLGGQAVTLEAGTPAAVIKGLRQRGHEVIPPRTPGNYGGGQIIRIDPESGALAGGSDPRKDGCAVGY
jgi:gamma-glutamyltranspeptidase/glutathione hydrolase